LGLCSENKLTSSKGFFLEDFLFRFSLLDMFSSFSSISVLKLMKCALPVDVSNCSHSEDTGRWHPDVSEDLDQTGTVGSILPNFRHL